LFGGATGGLFSTLNDLGISLDDTGSLTTDSAELNEKLANNLSDVEQFFSSETGLAQSFTTALAGYQDDDGILEVRTDNIDSRLDDIDDDRDTLTRRMDGLEARLRSQFIAMDLIVAQLSSVGTFLTGALASLPKPNSINRN
jgi:flagellar hook-associated protein 2